MSSSPRLSSVPKVAEEAEWLDAEAAGRYLNLPTDSIYRMIQDGQLPALRFPVRISRHDLDACFERCRVKPGELTGPRAG